MTTFDPQLSETVSLSEVLDELLRSNESPDTVMSFLESCGSAIPDVVSRSMCASKIPNLDFFGKLTLPSGRKLFNRVVEEFLVGPVESWLFLVQLSRTGPDAARICAGLDSSGICNRAALGHSLPRISKGNCLDELFLEPGSSIYYVAEKINAADDYEFDCLLAMQGPFLFHGRLLQEDLFLLLSDQKRFILLNNVFKDCWDMSLESIRGRFLIQLLCGEDEDVKVEVIRGLRNNVSPLFDEIVSVSGKEGIDVDKILDSRLSFPELFMEYASFGIESYARTILLVLLMAGRHDMLMKFAENEPELVERYLPVAGAVKRILAERHKIKRILEKP